MLLTAPQLFALSFAGLIAVGAMGFRWLPGLYAPGAERLSWLDAVFTATSAVCVTGLAVADTATRFTVWGQAWLLALIQLGGLGIIALTSVVAVALGRRLSLRTEALTMSALDAAPHLDERRLVRDVVAFTLAIEAAGAVALWMAFVPHLGARGALWPAVFHSISAFCSAGFSTFSTSLIGFQRDPAVLGIVGTLIVVGGLGFLTLEELAHWLRARRRQRQRFRLSLHSRLALTVTALLLVGGAAVGAAAEWTGTFGGLSGHHRWTNAAFFSVGGLTAGFQSIDYAHVSATSAFVTILLMFIGGSPGSTAGGIKTTTVALVGLLAYHRFRGRTSTGAFGRSVPPETVDRAVGVAALGFGVATLGILALTVTEGYRGAEASQAAFLPLMFEAVSALGTAGLSMNLTPTLGGASKGVVIALMFLGRIGPLTFAAAFARARRRPDVVRYAHEDVLVG